MLSTFFTRPKVVQTLRRFRFKGIGRRLMHAYENWIDGELRRSWKLRNTEAREAFEAERPALNDVERRVLTDLNCDGIARVPFSDLFGDAGYWDELTAAVQAWLRTPEVLEQEQAYIEGRTTRDWKEYLVRMFGRESIVAWDSLWLQLALQAPILNVVNHYMGLMTKLLSLDVWNTVPLDHAGPDVGSQRWHRDPEDVKLVKVFVYLSDVDERAGPLEYVKNSANGDRYGHLWPQELPRGSVPPAGELEQVVPPSQREVCTVPAGTILFVNTTGFHRGGRAIDKRRVLAIYTYTSHAVVWPRTYTIQAEPRPEQLETALQYALLR